MWDFRMSESLFLHDVNFDIMYRNKEVMNWIAYNFSLDWSKKLFHIYGLNPDQHLVYLYKGLMRKWFILLECKKIIGIHDSIHSYNILAFYTLERVLVTVPMCVLIDILRGPLELKMVNWLHFNLSTFSLIHNTYVISVAHLVLFLFMYNCWIKCNLSQNENINNIVAKASKSLYSPIAVSKVCLHLPILASFWWSH